MCTHTRSPPGSTVTMAMASMVPTHSDTQDSRTMHMRTTPLIGTQVAHERVGCGSGMQNIFTALDLPCLLDASLQADGCEREDEDESLGYVSKMWE